MDSIHHHPPTFWAAVNHRKGTVTWHLLPLPPRNCLVFLFQEIMTSGTIYTVIIDSAGIMITDFHAWYMTARKE